MKTAQINGKRMNSLDYILVADDDLDDQELIRDALEDNSFDSENIKFTNDGEQLLTFLYNATTLPKLVLLDLNMPRKTGQEVLRELKNSVKYKHIPVVVFTTSDSENDINECYQNGTNAYLTKPNQYDDLVCLMKDLIAFWFGHSHAANGRH